MTYGEKWYVGEEIFSSILLSAVNSWIANHYTPQGQLNVDLDLWKSREYGKIKASIYGFTSDLHNLAINYCLLNETIENLEVNKHKTRLYVGLLLENYFTNIRSLYDFLFHLIKICLTDTQLKSFPGKDSLNNLISFSKKANNEDKLPLRVRQFLFDIQPYLEEIRTIRDAIIHKGKEIVITKKGDEILIRIPKSGLYSNDTIFPNILNCKETDYNMKDYLREMTISLFKNSEDLGLVILSELFEKGKFNWNIHSITNYCMEDFTKFMLKQEKTFG
ncbi:hypothetical protein LV92_02639 [Arenibacter echinorum]|uniref:Cthe-2314-like HEPN domain-containing protein n=1 Tax=Arenibacter echinorum TaxID=440515 RepID=A0A327RCU6_9FLAO|nr:hypothetical protein LV92_02639 [Arenibacter echinorum]